MYKLETEKVDDSQEVSLYENGTIQDINGKDVETRRCIGVFSLQKLEEEKLDLETKIHLIDEKIAVINSI